MSQGADESHAYIACTLKIEAGLSVVSDDSDRVKNVVTMKLLTPVTDELTVAATMVKTVRNSTVLMLVKNSVGCSLFPRREEGAATNHCCC